jgi:hypothetical protein
MEIGREMTKAQIRRMYMETIEPRISEAVEKYSGQPEFDMLLEVCQGPEAYGFFFRIAEGLHITKNKVEFDVLCNLYGYLQYCWLDDGDVSLVCAYVDGGKMHSGYKTRNIFVLKGSWDELSIEHVSSAALAHGPEGARCQSFIATSFTPEALKFLHGLLPAQKAAHEIGDRGNYADYHNAEKAIKDTCEKYIVYIIRGGT